ncbi:MAG: hypothetical protein RR553_07795 [Akkermansia sp.]
MDDFFSSINAGELTPLLSGRHDLAKRKAGCKRLSNFIVLEHGGVSRRPGVSTNGVALRASKHRLIPFESSIAVPFLLDVYDLGLDVFDGDGVKIISLGSPWHADDLQMIQYTVLNDVLFLCCSGYPVYVLKHGVVWSLDLHKMSPAPQGDVKTAQVVAAKTDGSGVSNYKATYDFSSNEDLFFADMVGERIRLNRKFGRRNISLKTNNLKLVVADLQNKDYYFYDTVYVDEGGIRYFYTVRGSWSHTFYDANRGVSPANYPEYFGRGVTLVSGGGFDGCLFYAKSSWNLKIDGTFFASYELLCSYDTEQCSNIGGDLNDSFFPLVAFESKQPTATTCDFSGDLDGPCLLAVRLISQVINQQGNVSLVVGGFSQGCDYMINSVKDKRHAGVVSCEVQQDYICWSSFSAISCSFPAFSAKSGYPSAICFHQNRLFLAGTKDKPQSVWASAVDDYSDFEIGSDADDAMMMTILSQSRDKVQWMSTEDGVLIGTQSAEWLISGDGEKAISPGCFKIKRQSSVGSSPLQPIISSNASLYVSQSGSRLQEIAYSYERDGFASQDLSILAEHVCLPGIKEMAYQRIKIPVAWCVLNNCELVGCTYNRQQDVVSWHRHALGDGWSVESVAVIHDARGGKASGYDQVFLVVVKRDGTKWLARMRFRPDVVVWSDDGFVYDAFCALLPADFVGSDGSNSMGGFKRVSSAMLKIHEGTALRAGVDGEVLTDVLFSNLSQGWVNHVIACKSQREICFAFDHVKAEPFTLLCLNLKWGI